MFEILKRIEMYASLVRHHFQHPADLDQYIFNESLRMLKENITALELHTAEDHNAELCGVCTNDGEFD